MNIRLSLSALFFASMSLSCLADSAPNHEAAAPGSLAAPSQTAAERRSEREAGCSAALGSRLDDLAAKSLAQNPQWNANQRYQLDDAIATARSTPWSSLDSEAAARERQAASIRPGDERSRAATIAEEGRQAASLAPLSISKTEARRASDAAQSLRSLWLAQSKADASALHYARCMRAPAPR